MVLLYDVCRRRRYVYVIERYAVSLTLMHRADTVRSPHFAGVCIAANVSCLIVCNAVGC